LIKKKEDEFVRFRKPGFYGKIYNWPHSIHMPQRNCALFSIIPKPLFEITGYKIIDLHFLDGYFSGRRIMNPVFRRIIILLTKVFVKNTCLSGK